MYQFHKKTNGPAARPASTLLIARENPGFELFFVKRHKRSAFLGGAMVFPGGKLDDDDWQLKGTGAPEGAEPLAEKPGELEALAACACREALEEAGVFPVKPAMGASQVESFRRSLEKGESLSALLGDSCIDTASLVPFGRWVTPEAEMRRYDARFFLARLPQGQVGRCDDHETTCGVWASPKQMLAAFEAGEVFLAPPTLRCLELLAEVTSYDQALAVAREQTLLPICPKLLPGEPLRLALPGHPEHGLREKRVAGAVGFVFHNGRFISSDAPAPTGAP